MLLNDTPITPDCYRWSVHIFCMGRSGGGRHVRSAARQLDSVERTLGEWRRAARKSAGYLERNQQPSLESSAAGKGTFFTDRFRRFCLCVVCRADRGSAEAGL